MKTAKQSHRRAGAIHRYSVFYVPDEEAGGYTAHVPALGIVTEAETLRAARVMARDAIRGRILVLRDLKQPIPKDVAPERIEVRS